MGDTAPMTEERMLRLIQAKYAETRGNGPAWAFLPHVRDAAGFDAGGACDALVMALWPSRGLALHGFEVKVSRSDWLRELKKPEKAERFCRLVDYWWIAAGDKTIVRDGELPDTWGLMVADGRGLRVVKSAPKLRFTQQGKEPPVSRSFLAAILRQAGRVQQAGPIEIQEAVAAERKRLSAMHKDSYDAQERRMEELRSKIRRFEQAAGVRIEEWGESRSAEETGRLLRMVIDGHRAKQRTENRLRSVRTTAEGIIEEIDRLLPAEDSPDLKLAQ